MHGHVCTKAQPLHSMLSVMLSNTKCNVTRVESAIKIEDCTDHRNACASGRAIPPGPPFSCISTMVDQFVPCQDSTTRTTSVGTAKHGKYRTPIGGVPYWMEAVGQGTHCPKNRCLDLTWGASPGRAKRQAEWPRSVSWQAAPSVSLGLTTYKGAAETAAAEEVRCGQRQEHA